MQHQDYSRLLFPGTHYLNEQHQTMCNIVYQYLAAEMSNLCDLYSELATEQAKIVGTNTDFTYQKRTFTHYRNITEGVNELDASLHDEMENLLHMDRSLRELIVLMSNYVTNVLVHGRTKADHLALMQAGMHPAYLRSIDSYGARFNALCWLTEPTLTPTQVATFRLKNQSVVDRMNILELDTMTR